MKILPRFVSCLEALMVLGVVHGVGLLVLEGIAGIYFFCRMLRQGYCRALFSSK